MKNIVTITLTTLALLLVGFLATNFMPKNKDLSIYLPSSFSTSKTFMLADVTAREEPYTISLGATEDDSVEFKVTSMQGQYADVDNRFALAVIPQELQSGDMEQYGTKAWERFQAPSRGGISEKIYTDGYDMYISFRQITEEDDTSKMLTLGTGYVFVPEENVIVTYSLYNTRLYSCEDIFMPETCLFDEEKELPTIDDAKKIGEQIISYFKENI